MEKNLLQNKLVNRFLWVVLLLAVWEGVYTAGFFSPLVFPSLGEILKTLAFSTIKGELPGEILYSMVLILAGLTAGLAGAVILASLSMLSKIFNGFSETVIAIAHPLPGIALLPLVILWFGTGAASVVFIIVHSVLWPMALNIMNGFRAVPAVYREVGRNIGLGRWKLVRDVMLPGSMPYFLAGLKIGWARSWRALISAEMIFGAVGGKGGLGWYIFKQRVFMDTPGMFAGLAVIAVIGILVEDVVINRIEAATVKRWGMSI